MVTVKVSGDSELKSITIKPDAVDPIRFNQIVWRGIMGG